MPVESATYIHDLNAADPTHTDGINQMDSHLRLIKTVLQTTFPSLGTAAVNATAAQLNQAATANATAGALEVAANGSNGGDIVLDGPATAGSVLLSNTTTAGNGGSFSLYLYDHTNTTPTPVLSIDTAGNVTIAGSLTAASIKQGGNALLPTGCILQWSGSVASVPAGWHLCDGTAGTPDLRDKFVVGAGLSYAVAQTGGAAAVTAASDAQGAHSHGGATVASAPLGMSGSSDAQGSHSHGGVVDMQGSHAHNLPTTNVNLPAGPFSITVLGGSTTDVQGAHQHNVTADGLHAHNIAVSNVPAHTHPISVDGTHAHNTTVQTLPPYYALAFIMKL